MRKALPLIIICFIMAALTVHASADFTIPGTPKPPVIDGEIDECYGLIHDFYSDDRFKDDNDPDHVIKGQAFAAWDKDNFYFALTAYTPEQGGMPSEKAMSLAEGSGAYVAILGKADGTYTDDQRFEIGIAISEEGDQIWKTCSPGDIRDAYGVNDVWDECPFTFCVKRDEATKFDTYEWAIPWTFLDRSGQISFGVGSQMILNYSPCCHSADMWTDGDKLYFEYGGGIWADSYEDGATITLGVVIEAETEAQAEAAPAEPAASAAETAAPAAAAPAETAAPAAETAAPAPAAAPAAPAAAAQTGDAAAVVILAAVAALGTAVVVGKKH